VQKNGETIINDGDGGFMDYEALTDLLQHELGLEPDYIEDLWL